MAVFDGNQRLKYFSRELDNEGTLHILLVSTSQSYLDQLAHNLYIGREVQRDKRNYNLKVHTCKTILDVVQLVPGEFYVDYIIFVLDTHFGNCLVEVENNLSWLDASFTRDKICLVNPEPRYQKTIISPLEIWEFAKSHQFNLVNGKIKDQKGIFTLTKRILNLIEACCGIVNGIPMTNIV